MREQIDEGKETYRRRNKAKRNDKRRGTKKEHENWKRDKKEGRKRDKRWSTIRKRK